MLVQFLEDFCDYPTSVIREQSAAEPLPARFKSVDPNRSMRYSAHSLKPIDYGTL